MKKKLLIAGAALLMAAPVAAQNTDAPRKWSGEFDALIAGQSVVRPEGATVKTLRPDVSVDAIVRVTNAEAVAQYVQEAGYEAEVITPEIITVNIPAKFIPTLTERSDVRFVNATRRFHPLMDEARKETGAEQVQTGEGLETPFKGKGVVVGIIDQGFEYDHPAFGNRVVRYGASTTSGTLTSKRPSTDKLDEDGHATHVTNIAAGSQVKTNPYYGMAPEADLILISSTFQDNAVLKQAKAIKTYAEANDQPWVINMSFGGYIGPHDGSTDYDQGMSALCGEGGLMVAALGNEGGTKMHARRVIESADEPVYLKWKPLSGNDDKFIYSTLVSETTDGKEHLDIKFIIYSGGTRYEPTTAQMNNAYCYVYKGIDANSQRQYFTVQGSLKQLLSNLGISSTSSASFFFEVAGEEGTAFHAWTTPYQYPAEFASSATPYSAKSGDDQYTVGEGAASIGKCVAVGSYNARSQFTNMNGSTLGCGNGSTGAMSNFTSSGPFLGDFVKPAVCAPGGGILSAFSKNATYASDYSYYRVASVSSNGKSFYYGMMSGTSMASPAVTGILALWLEANPKLTYEDVMKILQKTSRRDKNTGDADDTGWNLKSGYGKIDAYEGLKMALEMANQSGINQTMGTEHPVSFMKSADNWKVLFNNDESFADVQVASLNGQVVYSRHIDQPRRGQEQVVDLQHLAPGVYLFNVRTLAGSESRKVVVK